MTIVLPHGVLFRGDALGGADSQGEGEGKIRRNLIENNNIEAIIGLPANIFFGTGIPHYHYGAASEARRIRCSVY